ncbi:sigma-70 family RNA polymerase sigma factor [Bacteroides sp. 51]|uniref:sigma-70 family RNA polymerase sigma factor n=1 Tax=Bacteroides sp. 51 TaxID=2302938 RepID=UPI0013D3C332|nr:sigma-70 family RNA polymerase sigma factor [Bacteroides sp. 51]NDV83666.1 sigma-70 family RNA polymerase sigma factor [Bacteroides sp. 51]
MKTQSSQTSHNSCLITHSYKRYHQIILSYITYKINHKYEAEDLMQDVFVRLLDYRAMLREDTVKYFLFTIARNIVTDYIRRYYKKQEITSYIYDTTVYYSNETEENLIVKDLLSLERDKLGTYSPQRKAVYLLSRFEEKTTSEIADELHLSKRTVENHLLIGRKIMRAYIRQCI